MIPMKSYAVSDVSKHYEELDKKLKEKPTGTFTHEIKGRPDYVNRQMNLFYGDLRSKYGNNWRVIDTTSHSIPTGVCMYITYETWSEGVEEEEDYYSLGEHFKLISVFGSKRNMECLNARIKDFHRELMAICNRDDRLCLIDTSPEFVNEKGYMGAFVTYEIFENTLENQKYVKEVIDDKEINAIGLAITTATKKQDAKDTIKALEKWAQATKIKLK